jgi:hypothetical protein
MYATNVTKLKENPSVALREAEDGPVLVLDGNVPNAVILHLDPSLQDIETGLRPALAAALYKDDVLSLGAAAELSGLAYGEFLQHLAALGIDVARIDETTNHETCDLGEWLTPS